ncbi:hypothetical protein LguiA_035800 [Lonicera macranthoides]
MRYLTSLETLWITRSEKLYLSKEYDTMMELPRGLLSLSLMKILNLKELPRGFVSATATIKYIRIKDCPFEILPELLISTIESMNDVIGLKRSIKAQILPYKEIMFVRRAMIVALHKKHYSTLKSFLVIKRFTIGHHHYYPPPELHQLLPECHDLTGSLA